MKVVAIVSGGLDSICNLAYWKANSDEVHALIFDYGQKGIKEVDVAKELCEKLKVNIIRILDISFMKQLWEGTQLTDNKVKVEEVYQPTVIVPLRNAVFLTIATAYAYSIGADVVTYGGHLTDCITHKNGLPMYPDSCAKFAKQLEDALWLGHLRGKRVSIVSPAYQKLTKAENLQRGYRILGDLIYQTWSCYSSGKLHCGICKSCRDRKQAFKDAGIEDKTEYAR